MAEQIKETTSSSEKNSNSSGHSHHSHSHHKHSKHKHSHHGHSSSSSKGSLLDFSLLGLIQKHSTTRVAKQIPHHRVVSQRILFCIILLCFVIGAVTGILSPGQEDENVNTRASTTRSEADQLRTQITILQLEKTELEKELQLYKNMYGELPEEEDEETTKKK
ncbi:MAG: hypothetical protein E7417_04650 [Ruminococcaceae bacterium]|nr:hypothetical protein [Oscillospiraceae bacterium]